MFVYIIYPAHHSVGYFSNRQVISAACLDVSTRRIPNLNVAINHKPNRLLSIDVHSGNEWVNHNINHLLRFASKQRGANATLCICAAGLIILGS